MKHVKKFFWVFTAVLFLAIPVLRAQKVYKFDTVPNDPLKVRIYTLDNGLKVYLTVYKDAPRIQTAIAVKTGSKNDPHDNTGLSHYLEHVMFKGTDEFGTKDYLQERPMLEQIEYKFEVYRQTTDTVQRKKIYHEIDSISQIASKYAIANEYDKLLAVIGAKGTNAFTSFEETVYINDIPSNKIKPWLEIEFERFKDPVFRLFHTELETVYEEKNMSLDNDDDKVFDSLFSGLFKKHTYGTQTTIGTVEHLKNPSVRSLREYFSARYVPNNMAIVMSGDFNPDEVIRDIDATFGQLSSRPVTPFVPPVEDTIKGVIPKVVMGPDAESVTIGYRLKGASTKDADLLTVFNMILSNRTAGLIDLNLNQGQLVLEAGAFAYILKDYSVEILSGKAKSGQSLDDVTNLLLDQIERVKNGAFPDWLIPAILNDIKLKEIRSAESNRGRTFTLVDGFVKEIPRSEEVKYVERLSTIKKEDIVDFAKQNFRKNFVIVYKRTGQDLTVQKVIKPAITPVTMNRDDESDFLKKIVSEPSGDIQPVFLDYNSDIRKFRIKSNIEVLYSPNRENNTFALYYYFRMGENHNKAIGLALDYLKYLGTSKYTAGEVQEEFYKIGCSFNVSSSEAETWVSLSGLSENMAKGVALFEHLLSDAQVNYPAWENMVSDINKRRMDDKLSKNIILWSAMYNYGVFGESSPFTNIYQSDSLKRIDPGNLVSIIQSLTSHVHTILYYGPETQANLTALLNKEHKVPASLQPVPAEKEFDQLPNAKTQVFTAHYDMKQVEIVMLSRSEKYKPELVPVIRLFNEYFGGGMNSIVFQEIRESKGLAYSAYAGYRSPQRPEYYNYLFSYIGTQIDKLPEAMNAMMGIFNNMPESEMALNASKEALLNKIRTERITKAQILFNYLNARKFGLTYDIRKDVFEKVPAMTFADLKSFQETYVKNKKFNIMVLGNKNLLDVKTLEKYGPVTPLTLEEIFGY
jgi:predicted Zn-dependent peptidase